jgi:hypothetical protein
MARQENPATQKAASADGKPSTVRKQSRMEEILGVIDEYASGHKKFQELLRKLSKLQLH